MNTNAEKEHFPEIWELVKKNKNKSTTHFIIMLHYIMGAIGNHSR